MRKSLIGWIPVILVAGIGVVLVTLVRDSHHEPEAAAASTPVQPTVPSDDLAVRMVQSGEVLVVVTPVRIDERAAVFEVGFETHSVDLSFDVASVSSLEVDGTEWGPATWSGSPEGGHHRSGTLTFPASGAAAGSAVLTIGGLPEPAVAEWTLPS